MTEAEWLNYRLPMSRLDYLEQETHRRNGGAVFEAYTVLTRDTLGNPFRPLPELDPTWLGYTVVALAGACTSRRTSPRCR